MVIDLSSKQETGKKMSPLTRKPHFFKVLVGDFKKRLRIPPKFMKHIVKEASQRVTLQGPNGSNWQAEISETINGNFLSAGWSNFVEDHSLKEHDFLVFRYNGNMHFNVMIFDTSACEREDLFEMKTTKNSACDGKKRRGRPVKRSLHVDCTHQHKSIRSQLPEPQSGPVPSTFLNQSCLNKAEDHVSSTNVNIKPIDVDLPIHTSRRKTSHSSLRRPVTAEVRSKAQEAAKVFYSKFPYIVLRMKRYYVYEKFLLSFPLSFSRTHLPRQRTNIVLRDPSGKDWRVVYISSSSGSHLSGGWCAFARGNNLEEGDFCAFELTGKVQMRVHIFRAVEVTTRLASVTEKNLQQLPHEEGHHT